MKHTLAAASEFAFAAIKGKDYGVTDAPFSISRISVDGAGSAPDDANLRYDFVFYIESGNGVFTVGDTEYSVSATDVIAVAKGKPFQYRGTMTFLELMMPAYQTS